MPRVAPKPHHPPRPLWRYYIAEVLAHWPYILFGVVVGGLFGWTLARLNPTLADTAHAEHCRSLYAAAKSAVDTARVDAIYPFGPGHQDGSTCGRLRTLGLLN